jgi:hypothetical protein
MGRGREMGLDRNEVGLPVGDDADKPEAERDSHRTRRQVLSGAAGALGAIVAGSVLRPKAADASTGDDLVIGTDNASDSGDPTALFNENIGSAALHPYAFGVTNPAATGPVPGAIGIYGAVIEPGFTNDDSTAIGVKGEASHGSGVWGASTSGPGLRAKSSTGDGTFSSTGGNNKSGVYGENTGGQGYFVISAS